MRLKWKGEQFVLSNISRVFAMEWQRTFNCARRRCVSKKCLMSKYRTAMCEYGGPRRRVRVDFTPALRSEVRDVLLQIRKQMLTTELPEAPNDRRCVECQLLHHCIPELTSAPRKVNRYMANVVFGCDT